MGSRFQIQLSRKRLALFCLLGSGLLFCGLGWLPAWSRNRLLLDMRGFGSLGRRLGSNFGFNFHLSLDRRLCLGIRRLWLALRNCFLDLCRSGFCRCEPGLLIWLRLEFGSWLRLFCLFQLGLSLRFGGALDRSRFGSRLLSLVLFLLFVFAGSGIRFV